MVTNGALVQSNFDSLMVQMSDTIKIGCTNLSEQVSEDTSEFPFEGLDSHGWMR